MAAPVTADDVKAIAALAQLELEPAEIDLFARQLSEFLGYAADVLAVDTTGVAPTAYVLNRRDSDRLDEARTSLDREAALTAAPDPSFDAGLFKVPRVIG